MQNRVKIAIVDDETEILNTLERFLKKSDYHITTYSNPITALSSISSDTNLVLLDVMMPQMNGLDLLPKLMEKNPNIKVVIMTAYSTLDKVLDAHRGGAVFYAMKPFESLRKLQEEIEKALKS